eukprot:gene6514-7502_t
MAYQHAPVVVTGSSNNSTEKDDDVNRNEYANEWTEGFWTAPCADPSFFCLSLLCSPCVSFHLRQRYYQWDMSKYECCAGKYKLPCDCCYCRNSECPECLLAAEVFLFHPCSIMGTRFALQDDLQLKNTCCDKVMLTQNKLQMDIRDASHQVGYGSGIVISQQPRATDPLIVSNIPPPSYRP